MVKIRISLGDNVFGYGLLIPHYGTIVVNDSIRAGNYCVLQTSTYIGGKGKVIGDGLYLSSGALIMGSEVILGDNMAVASNSMINKSVSTSNLLLVGNPATIKSTSLPWYERDGDEFKRRVETIEKLRQNMKL